MASTGTDVQQAMTLLGEYGWTPYRLANELGVHTRTARRWAAGIHQPSARNLTALRGTIGALALKEYGQPGGCAALLEAAQDALKTAADRAADAAFDAEMRERRAAIVAERQPETPAVPARIAAADPFALVAATSDPQF